MSIKVHMVKAIIFPVVMYGRESWTMKKAEHRKVDVLELWCWRRLLRVPWTGRRSNQSILKEINPEYILEGLMLKLQYFGHLMQRADIEKDPDAGKDWRKKQKRAAEDEMVRYHHQSNGHEFEQISGNSGRQRSLVVLQSTESQSTEHWGIVVYLFEFHHSLRKWRTQADPSSCWTWSFSYP